MVVAPVNIRLSTSGKKATDLLRRSGPGTFLKYAECPQWA
jgi:hypothetical protein